MRVLVPVDNSDCSRKMLSELLNRSWPDGTEFGVVTVVPYYQLTGAGVDWIPGAREARHVARDSGEQLVKDVALQILASLSNASAHTKVIQGDVVQSIVQFAADWQADLILMGSHGAGTAEDVSCQAACPVEIVESPSADAEET